MTRGLIKGVTELDHFATQRADRIDLNRRCRGGHDNHAANTQRSRALSNALGMVTRTGRNHASIALGLGQVNQFIVGTTVLKRIDRLEVFTFI